MYYRLTDQGKELLAEFHKMQELVRKFAQFGDDVIEEIEEYPSKDGGDAQHLEVFEDRSVTMKTIDDEWGYEEGDAEKVVDRLLHEGLVEELMVS